jgi:E3 ubiquitin-protein ligase RNF115/126/E3 ubiquitin-protein ligase RNF38/44
VEPPEQDQTHTQITIRFTTNRRRSRSNSEAVAPVATSPTQLAQAMTGEGGAGPANSAETVSSEWPPAPESDAVMSEARQGEGFFD